LLRVDKKNYTPHLGMQLHLIVGYFQSYADIGSNISTQMREGAINNESNFAIRNSQWNNG